ncbi:MAG: hypothetical protein RL095_3470 [Verrucomicrobiota bacterium]|jgi:hypothetical protein
MIFSILAFVCVAWAIKVLRDTKIKHRPAKGLGLALLAGAIVLLGDWKDGREARILAAEHKASSARQQALLTGQLAAKIKSMLGPAEKLLVLLPPDTPENQIRLTAVRSGLEKILPGRHSFVTMPSKSIGGSGKGSTWSDWNKLTRSLSPGQKLLSYIQLPFSEEPTDAPPQALQELTVMEAGTRFQLILAEVYSGSMGPLLQEGKVALIQCNLPLVQGQSLPGDDEQAAQLLGLLIAPDNVEQLHQSRPELNLWPKVN